LSSEEPPTRSLLAPDTAPLADMARRALLRSLAGRTHSVSSMRSATGACAIASKYYELIRVIVYKLIWQGNLEGTRQRSA